MKIKAVRVRDFKGVRDVAIEPGPTLVMLAGRNGQGKSSVLDGIAAAIGGAGESPGVPIRRGAESAEVVVDLGDLVVKRKWTKEGSKLYLENPDGSRPRSPQTLLDSLLKRVTFDPMSFSRTDGREMAKLLRTLAGLDGDLDRLDRLVKETEEERKELNRAVRADEGALAQYGPEPEMLALPDTPVDPAEAATRYQAAVEERGENQRIRDQVERDRRRADDAAEKLKATEATVARLEKELAAARASHQRAGEHLLECVGAHNESKAIADGLVDPDADGAKALMSEVEAHNARVRQRREWQALRERWIANREAAATLTSRIQGIEAEKEAKLSSAPYPVPGLAVRGDDVTLHGVPVDQVNAAAKVTLGLAVGAALNPGLKVALVRDASLLDDESLAAVADWAKSSGFQVWLEMVNPGDPEGVVVIEDGTVASAPGRPQDRPRMGTSLTPKMTPFGFDDTEAQAGETF